jgi:hypothetical protein
LSVEGVEIRVIRVNPWLKPLFLSLFGGGHQLLLLMQQILAFPAFTRFVR